MRRCLMVLGLSLHLGFSEAQTPLPALTPAQVVSIDTFVSAEMARQQIPGLQLGIYSRGKILLAKGYGLANVELQVPVKPDSLFQSGSVGKQFVSAAIMMLVEQGKVSLDDSIVKYFPNAPSTWKPILIKNLLSHTSGLADYEDSSAFSDPADPFYLRFDFTEDQLTNKFYKLAIQNAPGDAWAYRNANYVLLGILIHRVTGKVYSDFLGERIFRPLGMSQTQLINDRNIVPNRVAGYEVEGAQLKNQAWVSPTFNSLADGALYFNALDISKWDASLYTNQLLKQSSLDRSWTVYPLNDGKPNPAGYGFGWYVGDQVGHKLIEHGGAWQGFTCDIARYPDEGISVAVLTNLDSRHSSPKYIAHVVAGLADQPLLPKKLSAATDMTTARTARLSAILTDISTGTDFSSETAPPLSTIIRNVLPTMKEKVASVWPGGTLTLLKQTPVPGTSGGRGLYRITKGDQAILARFALTDGGKISTLRFFPNREYDDELQ